MTTLYRWAVLWHVRTYGPPRERGRAGGWQARIRRALSL